MLDIDSRLTGLKNYWQGRCMPLFVCWQETLETHQKAKYCKLNNEILYVYIFHFFYNCPYIVTGKTTVLQAWTKVASDRHGQAFWPLTCPLKKTKIISLAAEPVLLSFVSKCCLGRKEVAINSCWSSSLFKAWGWLKSAHRSIKQDRVGIVC